MATPDKFDMVSCTKYHTFTSFLPEQAWKYILSLFIFACYLLFLNMSYNLSSASAKMSVWFCRPTELKKKKKKKKIYIYIYTYIHTHTHIIIIINIIILISIQALIGTFMRKVAMLVSWTNSFESQQFTKLLWMVNLQTGPIHLSRVRLINDYWLRDMKDLKIFSKKKRYCMVAEDWEYCPCI